jgi:hypothetical protein
MVNEKKFVLSLHGHPARAISSPSLCTPTALWRPPDLPRRGLPSSATRSRREQIPQRWLLVCGSGAGVIPVSWVRVTQRQIERAGAALPTGWRACGEVLALDFSLRTHVF